MIRHLWQSIILIYDRPKVKVVAVRLPLWKFNGRRLAETTGVVALGAATLSVSCVGDENVICAIVLFPDYRLINRSNLRLGPRILMYLEYARNACKTGLERAISHKLNDVN